MASFDSNYLFKAPSPKTVTFGGPTLAEMGILSRLGDPGGLPGKEKVGSGQMCSPYTVGREPGTTPFSVWNSGPSGRSPPHFRVGRWVPSPLLLSPASAPTSRKRGVEGGGCRPQNPTPRAKAWTGVGSADREGVAAV